MGFPVKSGSPTVIFSIVQFFNHWFRFDTFLTKAMKLLINTLDFPTLTHYANSFLPMSGSAQD
jgi:hypothetical protein